MELYFIFINLKPCYKDADQTSQSPIATDDDVRITKIGEFLRLAKLNELPQLINIL